jgi:hypothetical protein
MMTTALLRRADGHCRSCGPASCGPTSTRPKSMPPSASPPFRTSWKDAARRRPRRPKSETCCEMNACLYHRGWSSCAESGRDFWPSGPTPRPRRGSNMAELLPCPFCGSYRISSDQHPSDDGWCVSCATCGARSREDDPDVACAAWNRRTRPPATESENPTDRFLDDVHCELVKARTKFPGRRIMLIALAEEFGELAKALLDESSDRVRKEAIQTAVMAARVALDGDESVDWWRSAKGLDGHAIPEPDATPERGDASA